MIIPRVQSVSEPVPSDYLFQLDTQLFFRDSVLKFDHIYRNSVPCYK